MVVLAVQMLALIVVVVQPVWAQLPIQAMEAMVVRVLPVKVVVVLVLVGTFLAQVAQVARLDFLRVAEAVAVQQMDQTQALAVLVVMACAVSTLGKELI